MSTTLSTERTPPGPAALPLLGGREALVQFFRNPITFLTRLHQDYGDIVAFTRQHPTWLAVYGPNANQQLLTQPEQFQLALLPFRTAPNTALRRLSSGLPFMEYTNHKQRRQLLHPCFRRQPVAAYADDIVTLVHAMLDDWQVGAQRDICQDMHDLTIQIGAQLFFGIQSSITATTLGVASCRWIELAGSLPVALLPVNLPGTPFHTLHSISDELETRYRAIIAATRAEPGRHAAMVNTLLQSCDAKGIALSDDEIIGHLHTIALASSDATANGLSWTLFLLAQHPTVLADLRDEIDGALHGAVPTVDDLARLPLLERVIKESLRILPPAAYLVRRSVAATMLGPFVIPAQAYIIYSPYITHHMPELHTQPERFYPDRWLDTAPPPYGYIPFGAGAYACIGAIFAMQTMQIALTLILQRFSLQVVPGARIDRQIQITMSPKYGMPMIIKPRDARLERTPVRGNIHEMVELI